MYGPQNGQANISDKLQRVLAYEPLPPRQSLEELDKAEFEELKALALGSVPHISPGMRTRAIRTLAIWGTSDDCLALGEILRNKGEMTELRAVAASNLGLMLPESAEQELLPMLYEDDPLVLTKILKSLSAVGSRQTLAALNQLEEPKQEFVRKQLAFAKALIAYRLGLEEEPIPFVEGIERQPGYQQKRVELNVSLVKGELIKASIEKLDGSTFGIKPDPDTGFEVQAGKARWVLFLNSQFGVAHLLRTQGKQKMVIGLLSRYSEEHGRFSVQYIVLGKPGKNLSMDIMVVRTDGEVFYSGHTNFGPDIIRFSISDVQRLGTAPTTVKGHFNREGVKLEVSLPFGKREGKHQASPIVSGIYGTS